MGLVLSLCGGLWSGCTFVKAHGKQEKSDEKVSCDDRIMSPPPPPHFPSLTMSESPRFVASTIIVDFRYPQSRSLYPFPCRGLQTESHDAWDWLYPQDLWWVSLDCQSPDLGNWSRTEELHMRQGWRPPKSQEQRASSPGMECLQWHLVRGP